VESERQSLAMAHRERERESRRFATDKLFVFCSSTRAAWAAPRPPARPARVYRFGARLARFASLGRPPLADWPARRLGSSAAWQLGEPAETEAAQLGQRRAQRKAPTCHTGPLDRAGARRKEPERAGKRIPLTNTISQTRPIVARVWPSRC